MTNAFGFSIIIPNYNGAIFLEKCLNSLYQNIQQFPKIKFEIILINNAPNDNSKQIFQDTNQKYFLKNVKYLILENSKNLGFAKSVNQGIKKSKYKYLVITNNDLVFDKNWFKLIYKTIFTNKNPQVATFFGTVLNSNGTKFESQGFKFDYSGKCNNISNGKIFNKQKFLQSNKIIWGASAALIVYQKDIIQNIDLFDNDFFAYEEDVDLALRLNKLNYQTIYVPQAISYHLGGGTSNRMGNFRNRMDAKNWIYIIIKNYSAKDFWTNFFPIILERLKNLYVLIKKSLKTYGFKSIFYLPCDLIKTYGEVILNLPKMFQKRRQIKKLLKYNNN